MQIYSAFLLEGRFATTRRSHWRAELGIWVSWKPLLGGGLLENSSNTVDGVIAKVPWSPCGWFKAPFEYGNHTSQLNKGKVRAS